jgi:hypothetical protein
MNRSPRERRQGIRKGKSYRIFSNPKYYLSTDPFVDKVQKTYPVSFDAFLELLETLLHECTKTGNHRYPPPPPSLNGKPRL